MNINLTLFGQTIAMIVFVWFCMKFIWPPLMKAIEDRRKTIADGIAAGEKGQQELAEARHGAEAIVQEARQKALQVVDLAHKRSNEMVGEAKHTAQAEGQRIVAAAHTEITTSQSKARDALRRELASHVVAGAARVLGREVDAKTHAALIEELAAELEKQASKHG